MPKRRTFLKTAAVTGMTAGSLSLGSPPSQAAEKRIDPRKPFKRTSRFKSELVTIGMVGGNGAHTRGIWGQNWNPDDTHIRTTGMNCQYVWCLREEDNQFYKDKYGFEPVRNPEDMIGKIDGVFVDDFDGTAVNHLMAKPFLEAGIPTFVNRPCSTSMEKTRFLTETADKHKTPLMCGSTWEYTESCGDVRASLRSVNEIKGYVAHNSMSDYYTHGVHGVYYIYSCLKDEIRKGRGAAVAASYMTPDWKS
ncbi:MAG: twin-arginine translocation signal domain-containing protein, partial [Candidatus Latescibacteria bacterium]|nr:twin-arginine translocation signal domain-containing protein [Candidatus Latescibacterota bacterium]